MMSISRLTQVIEKIFNGSSVKTRGNDCDMTCPLVSKLISSDGNGGGVSDLVGNYSAGSTDFYITANPGKVLYLARVNINVQDGGSIDSNSYGNGVLLTNGVKLIESIGGVENQLGIPIITNSDYSLLAGVDINPLTFGSGDSYLAVRFTFSKLGRPLVITENDKFIIRLEDDFTALTGHKFMMQGYEVTL